MNHKLRNFVGLASGYALGQGSFLIASAYLLLKQRSEDVTEIGVAVTTLTLLQQTFDYGGTSYLARKTRSFLNGSDRRETIADFYLRFSLLRLAVAVIAGSAVLASLSFLGEMIKTRSLIIEGALGLSLWSFNTIGILDGRNASGQAGLVVAPPWFLMSALIVSQAAKGAINYNEIGLAFIAGVAASLTLQLLAIKSDLRGASLKGVRFTKENLTEDIAGSTAIFLSAIPGQITGRIYIYAAAAFMRPQMAAAFIFARTLLNASNNILLLTRRAEFANLIDGISGCRDTMSVLRLQKGSLLATIVVVSASLLAMLVVNLPGVPGQFTALRLPINLVGIFSLTLLVTYLTGAQIQGLLAIGGNRHLLQGTYLLLALAVASTPFIKPFGVTAIWAAVFVSNLATIPVFARGLKSVKQ